MVTFLEINYQNQRIENPLKSSVIVTCVNFFLKSLLLQENYQENYFGKKVTSHLPPILKKYLNLPNE